MHARPHKRSERPCTRAATSRMIRRNAQRSASFLFLLNGEDRLNWIDGHLVPVALLPLIRDVIKRRHLLLEMAELLGILTDHLVEAFAPLTASSDPDAQSKKALDRAINRAIRQLDARDRAAIGRNKPPLMTPRILAVMQDLKLDELHALKFCVQHNAMPLPFRKAYMVRLHKWEPRFG